MTAPRTEGKVGVEEMMAILDGFRFRSDAPRSVDVLIALRSLVRRQPAVDALVKQLKILKKSGGSPGAWAVWDALAAYKKPGEPK